MNYTTKEFEQLFRANYPRMYRYAYSILRDEEEAKDAVSQVFTQVWQNKPPIAEGRETVFLLTAVRNQSLKLLRKRRPMASAPPSDMPDSQYDSSADEVIAQLYSVIFDDLTEQDQRILSLHYRDNMTYQQTARRLGISPSAVNKHITKALAKIRAKLKHKQ